MIAVGQKVRFDPFKEHTGFASGDCKGNIVTGTVVYVNKLHKWFLVEHRIGSETIKTSFKFWQIGKDVTVCG